MGQKPYYIAAHIASQLSRKCLEVRHQNIIKSNIPESLFVSKEFWKDFLGEEIDSGLTVLSWLSLFLQRQNMNLAYFIEQIIIHIKYCQEQKATYVLFCDDLYPPLLKHIKDPPLGFTVKGDPTLLKSSCIAIIGSRRAHQDALVKSYELAKFLCQKGHTVVSGGAYGVDISAHLGVLSIQKKKAQTIAVMAAGLNCLYPKKHLKIFERFIEQDAVLLSERLFDDKPMPYDFPIRNRIISGMCQQIFVMQAMQASGAMVTANTALDQGRDVFVLSPPNGYPAYGSLALIEDGAFSFQSIEDLMPHLGASYV